MNEIIDKIKERYKEFSENEKRTWQYRFIWRGLDGDSPKYTLNIFNFIEENTDKVSKLGEVTNIDEFFKVTKKLADEYVRWVKNSETFNDNEYFDLEDFFKGAIGEFFFTYLLGDVCCLYSQSNVGDDYKRKDFSFVAPRLKQENDFGVDLTCIVNDKPSAVQVKFWNPYIKGNIVTNEIAQSCFADAVCNNFINPTEEENIVICWLGSTDRISKYLRKNTQLFKHILFIDKDALKTNIDNRNKMFWTGLCEKLINFAKN